MFCESIVCTDQRPHVFSGASQWLKGPLVLRSSDEPMKRTQKPHDATANREGFMWHTLAVWFPALCPVYEAHNGPGDIPDQQAKEEVEL